MTSSHSHLYTRLFGILTLLLSAIFILNMVLGKLHALKLGNFPSLEDATEFLVLLLAAGSLVAYTCTLPSDAPTDGASH